MAMVLDAFIQIIVEKLVDNAIKEILFLQGMESEMENLKRNLERIRLVLVDAESKKIENKTIYYWLGELREQMYEIDDLLDDCTEAGKAASTLATSRRARIKVWLRSVPGLSHLFSVVFRHKIGTRIQKINSNLGRLNLEILTLQLLASQPNADKKVCRYNNSRKNDTCPIHLDSDVVGIDDDATQLVDRITGESTRAHCVFGITGIPGIGKTTLAKKVFNHDLIQNHFEITVWICVSSNCHGEYLLKEIIRSIKKNCNEEERDTDENENCVSLTELSSKLVEVVKGRRILIILDDIWDVCFWEEFLREPLYTGAKYSRILITTRNQGIAKRMKAVHTYPMRSMLLSNGWVMLCKIVFEEEDETDMNQLEEIGVQIVKKCKGLPLAIKVVGGVLKTIDRTQDAWKCILSSKTWSMQDLPDDVQPSLLLSYEDLPSHMKHCFIYCSLFPEDFVFNRPTLIQMWIAEGFIKKVKENEMEVSAKDYYNELVMRNLLQVIPNCGHGVRCKMHDLLRSLAHFVSQNQYIYVDLETLNCRDSTIHRHLSFIKKELDVVPKEIVEHDCVRTLLVSRNPKIKTISYELLSKLKRLRVLDLAHTGVETLPDSLGVLIHLRFLNISCTKLRELPSSIKNLKNLETLKALRLKYLRSLPIGIVELNNLRCLLVSNMESQLHNMPNGMDKLKRLRILYGFVANEGVSRVGCQLTPNMKELHDLCELTELTIYKLQRVASMEEAKEAALENKTRLEFLKLSCQHISESRPPTKDEIEKIEKVFAGIRTPESLKRFIIEGFFGKELPCPITSGSLCQVTFLRLDGCKFVRQLPSLGDMPKLEILQVFDAASVVELGSEFFGIHKFPKLQQMILRGMTNLETMCKVKQGSLPCLQKLDIRKCPNLKSLPEDLQYATFLKQLVVEEAQNLESIGNLSSLTRLIIKENPRLRSIENLRSLNIMNIRQCHALENVKNIGGSYLCISIDGRKQQMQGGGEWMW